MITSLNAEYMKSLLKSDAFGSNSRLLKETLKSLSISPSLSNTLAYIRSGNTSPITDILKLTAFGDSSIPDWIRAASSNRQSVDSLRKALLSNNTATADFLKSQEALRETLEGNLYIYDAASGLNGDWAKLFSNIQATAKFGDLSFVNDEMRRSGFFDIDANLHNTNDFGVDKEVALTGVEGVATAGSLAISTAVPASAANEPRSELLDNT